MSTPGHAASHPPNKPRALVVGFGPFGRVAQNPSEALARAMDTVTTARWTVVGRVMPVSYRRCIEVTARALADVQPYLLLGVGVAVGRRQVTLERFGRARWRSDRSDVDGHVPGWRRGAGIRPARLPVDAMARAADIGVSDDCGDYVCNAWLYTMLGAVPEHTRVGFVHVPPSGFTVEGMRRMLDAVQTAGSACG